MVFSPEGALREGIRRSAVSIFRQFGAHRVWEGAASSVKDSSSGRCPPESYTTGYTEREPPDRGILWRSSCLWFGTWVLRVSRRRTVGHPSVRSRHWCMRVRGQSGAILRVSRFTPIPAVVFCVAQWNSAKAFDRLPRCAKGKPVQATRKRARLGLGRLLRQRAERSEMFSSPSERPFSNRQHSSPCRGYRRRERHDLATAGENLPCAAAPAVAVRIRLIQLTAEKRQSSRANAAIAEIRDDVLVFAERLLNNRTDCRRALSNAEPSRLLFP